MSKIINSKSEFSLNKYFELLKNNIQKILLRTENYILTYNILDKEKSKTNKLLALKEKQEYIEENFQKGCANKSLDVEEFNLMKIPIPSIEKQEEIIEYCDNNLIIIENLNKTIEGNKKIINDIINSYI